MSNLRGMVEEMGRKAKLSSRLLAASGSDRRNRVLQCASELIQARSDSILECNQADLAAAEQDGLSAAMIDRLKIDHQCLQGICDTLDEIGKQPDPLNMTLEQWTRPSGLHIRRVTTPLGVIGVIYESRPNVTIDAGALCLKAGNAVILRCGSSSFATSRALHGCLQDSLRNAGLPEDSVQFIPVKDREAVGALLSMSQWLDVIVPRGGRRLVERVQAEAKVPVFAHLEGICHVYVDGAADIDKARQIVRNSKLRRTGICGAAECILVDQAFWRRSGAPFLKDLVQSGVEVRADPVLAEIEGTVAASEDDFGREFLDSIVAARCVEGVDGAIEHISRYGSGHTDAIVTENDDIAQQFFSGLDSAILMRNASTQFADGGEFGMGAEIGIATGKIHARGPIGLRQLTSFKYLVEAQMAVRA